MTGQIFRRLTTTPDVMKIFSDTAMVQAMLDFEKALAFSEAKCKIFDEGFAEIIGSNCKVEKFSIADLSDKSVDHGTIVVPLVRRLIQLVSSSNKSASGWIHFGATSQDVIDTAMVMQLKKAIKVLKKDILRIDSALSTLIEKYGDQVMIGRTLLQPSVPIKFEQKLSGWRSAISRSWDRVEKSASEALLLQFGGAAGNLSALGVDGEKVRKVLSNLLNLDMSNEVWHVHRDRFVALCSSLSILVGALGKTALDISLLMQFEVSEVFEKTNLERGRSSAMPHKRNPVGCLIALSAAKRVPHLLATLVDAMPHEHERALGGWQVEWVTIPDIVETTAGSLAAIAGLCENLEIDQEKMKNNLDSLNGLFMSEKVMLELSKKIGKEQASQIISEACSASISKNQHLKDVLQEDIRFMKLIDQSTLDKLMLLE